MRFPVATRLATWKSTGENTAIGNAYLADALSPSEMKLGIGNSWEFFPKNS